MSTFEEAVEAGAEILFLKMRRDMYRDMPWNGLAEEVRGHWRKGFAAGLSVANAYQDRQRPEYRLSYRSMDPVLDGEWRICQPSGDRETEVKRYELFLRNGYTVRLEQRWRTEWTEVQWP